MDIKKIATQINGTRSTEKNREANQSRGLDGTVKKQISDKVSLDGYPFRKNEAMFARSELDKLQTAAFDKVKAYKLKLNEFEQAEKISSESVRATELGKMLNDPEVWEQIARKILDH